MTDRIKLQPPFLPDDVEDIIQRTDDLLERMLDGEVVFTEQPAIQIRRLAVQLQEYIDHCRERAADA